MPVEAIKTKEDSVSLQKTLVQEFPDLLVNVCQCHSLQMFVFYTSIQVRIEYTQHFTTFLANFKALLEIVCRHTAFLLILNLQSADFVC